MGSLGRKCRLVLWPVLWVLTVHSEWTSSFLSWRTSQDGERRLVIGRPTRSLRRSEPKEGGFQQLETRVPSDACTCSSCWRSNLLRGVGGAAGLGLLLASGQPEKLSKAFLVQEMAGMADYERLVRERKAQTFQKAIKTNVERLVEVGVGAGVNFPYFKQAGVKEVVAVEPNLNFLQKAQAAADRADIQLQVRQGVMEKMPFEDNSVDVVVGTLLLCSVQDLRQSISEVQRVLRPGGRYIFTEHVRAADGEWLRSAQDLLDPLQQAFAAGCHLSREPLPLIQETFEKVNAERWSLFDDEFTGGKPSGLPPHFLLAPHISGYAEV